jgi:hypothetical protein
LLKNSPQLADHVGTLEVPDFEHCRLIISALCAFVLAISATMLPRVPGGELVFLICGLGATGALFRQFVPKPARLQ